MLRSGAWEYEEYSFVGICLTVTHVSIIATCELKDFAFSEQNLILRRKDINVIGRYKLIAK